jgi:hypothetical protein
MQERLHPLDELYETQADYWNDLSKPFPYRHQWAGPPELLKAINEEDPNEMDDEDRRGKLIDEYWQVASRDGSINICEYGCNLRSGASGLMPRRTWAVTAQWGSILRLRLSDIASGASQIRTFRTKTGLVSRSGIIIGSNGRVALSGKARHNSLMAFPT